ncbi:nuclear pore complex protein Nup153 [Aplochiton taeniatus]
MAATGGGKIRSRRYHIASKPYAKSKQQPGLISRVTDTVKSIVPSWLQKYFKNGEDVEGGGATAEVVQNNQTPPPNGSQERARHIDEQDSQEPSTSNTEPSTSRATLNFQDHVLSRPPLNRSHLHFPPLDASSPVLGGSSLGLFSHPSTSASGPFSTGIGAFTGASSSSFSLVKEIKDNCSQHEDDNISTTSGFSSRASEKDVPTSKTASIPQLWSPEMDRTHSGPQRSQSSLKKPAFNLSVFGTSTNSTMNSSVLNSSQLGDSPFYPGKTTYGGAAAVRTAFSRPGTPYQAPVRRQIKAKPAGAQPCGVTSATARRILQSLERMSSPLADAKRIPSAAPSPLSAKLDGASLDISHFQAKKKRMDPSFPPVQRLVIPAAASVSGNRSMSFKPSLTPGGLGRTVDRTPRDTPTRQSPLMPEVTAVFPESTSSLPLPLSSTPVVSGTASGGGKMKRERTSTRPSSKRPDEEEMAEVPDLPAISLPISTFSLPTFSFSTPPTTTSNTPTATAVTPAKEPASEKEPPTASTPPCDPFTFSSPIVMATAASPPSFSPSAGFTFSVPVARAGLSVSNGNIDTPLIGAVKTTPSESTEEFEGPFKPAKVLKQGSVLDLLKAPGFASPVARSSPGPEAASQPAPAVTTAPSSSTGFGDLFKAPAGSWDCNVCMVQNKPTSAKCVACSSPQPNSSSSSKPLDFKPPATTSTALGNSITTTTTTTSTQGFGGLFATPAGTWDCDTCLVQNKPEAVKCVACEMAKPGTGVKSSLTLPIVSEAKTLSTSSAAPNAVLGFGDKFKKADGVWECETCMIENKGQDTKCVACMSPKPGAAASVSTSSSSAPALASVTPLIGFGDKFKKPEGAWECDTCCVQNKAADVQCVSCQTVKPGAKVEPKAFGSSSFGTFNSSSDSSSGSGGFKFGVALANSTSSSSSDGFKFGTSSSDSSTTGGFKFGGSTEGFKFGDSSTASPANDSDKKAAPPTMGAGFKFGGSIAFGVGADTTESKPSDGGFTFGQSKSDEESAAAATTTAALPSSAFSFGAAPQEKSQSEAASTNTTSTVSSASLPVFGTLTESSATTTAALGGSAFGAPAEKEPAPPSFTFGKPEVKEAPSMISGFLFAPANKESEAAPAPSLGGFSFSKPAPPNEQDKPSFTFGKPAEVAATPAAEAPKPSFNFGQSSTDTTSAPAFGFMASAPCTASTTAAAPSLFGAPSSSTPASNLASTAATSTFMFGQSSSSDGPPAKAFMFGQSQDSQAAAPTISLNAAPASAQPFLFGNVTTAAPAASSFTFGAAAPSAASSAAPSAAPSPFVFSSAPPAGFGSGQAPSFGQVSSQSSAPAFGSPAPSPFAAAVSQPAAFGAKPNAVPVFGQQANATPVFGATTNSTAAGGGFQFGGASAFGSPSGSTGVFAFGAGSGAPPAPAATPSIAQPPSAPGGGFNFPQPPSFNIGAVNSNFTATQTTQQAIAGRKIKTAIRRRK